MLNGELEKEFDKFFREGAHYGDYLHGPCWLTRAEYWDSYWKAYDAWLEARKEQ